jgi:hypothetical protein
MTLELAEWSSSSYSNNLFITEQRPNTLMVIHLFLSGMITYTLNCMFYMNTLKIPATSSMNGSECVLIHLLLYIPLHYASFIYQDSVSDQKSALSGWEPLVPRRLEQLQAKFERIEATTYRHFYSLPQFSVWYGSSFINVFLELRFIWCFLECIF